MRKEEYIKRYGEEAYEEYKKKQKALAKSWRKRNIEQSRKYALEHYYREDKLKISAVYKIVNEVTGDSYIGSSKDVEHRWAQHTRPSSWAKQPNSQLYKDMQKYGVDKFRFQILAPVIPESLKQVEQEFIEMLKPTYNDRRAKASRNCKEICTGILL